MPISKEKPGACARQPSRSGRRPPPTASPTSLPTPEAPIACCSPWAPRHSPRPSRSTCRSPGCLPGRVEQGAYDRRAVDLARVGVDTAVVHRILGDQVELILFDPNIAQSRRQSEPGDQPANGIGGGLFRMPESLGD